MVEQGGMVFEVFQFGAQHVLGVRYAFRALDGADVIPVPGHHLMID